MSTSLKVEWEKINKKIEFPKSFEDLVNSSKKWISYNNDIYYLVFKDSKSDLIVSDESSFNEYKTRVVGTGKLIAITKSRQDIENDIYMSNINENKSNNNIENISEIKSISMLEDIDESQLKDNVKKIVSKNTKVIKQKLMEEILNKIKSQSIIENTYNKDLPVHEGIKCCICNICPIRGKRFKCIKCKDINICEQCEAKKEHNIYHILLQITNPINKDLLENICNININYSVDALNYSISPKTVFAHKGQNQVTEKFVLKNTGFDNWFNGYSLYCSKYSQIIGSSIRIGAKIVPNTSTNVEITFNIKDLPFGKYKVYYQMCNNQKTFFGPLSEIIITIW